MSDDRTRTSGSQWLPDGTGIVSNGEVGGDDQVGESYSVRFLRSDVPGAIITRTAYPVNVGDDCKGQFLVQVETAWLVCLDPKDPGGTEVWSDRSTKNENELYGTAAEAERAARDVASELVRDAGSLTWSGLPEWSQTDT